MDVTARLDSLRADLVGCDLVAFADLTTQMVLCVSAAARHAQEELDALTETAASVLRGAVAEGGQALLDGSSAQTVVSMTPVGMNVFLQSSLSEKEALICVCAADADLAKTIAPGSEALDDITAVQP